MSSKEPRPIGRLRKHVRALFDAITREELPQDMRQLVDQLQQAEPVSHRSMTRSRPATTTSEGDLRQVLGPL